MPKLPPAEDFARSPLIPDVWMFAFTSLMHVRYGLMPHEYVKSVNDGELILFYKIDPTSAVTAADVIGDRLGVTRIDKVTK